jgi:hypothetical protein
MAFSENVIEIPRVLPGKRVSVEINVENRCPHSFEISKVLLSCGCLNVSAKVKTIAQGDSSRFKFEFQSPKNSGVFAVSADLVDETSNRTLRLVFKGACQPLVSLSCGPKLLVDGDSDEVFDVEVKTSYEEFDLDGLEFAITEGPLVIQGWSRSAEGKSGKLVMKYVKDQMGNEPVTTAVVKVSRSDESLAEIDLEIVSRSRFKIAPSMPVFRFNESGWKSRVILTRAAGDSDKITAELKSHSIAYPLVVSRRLLNSTTQIVYLSLVGNEQVSDAVLDLSVGGFKQRDIPVTFEQLEK